MLAQLNPTTKIREQKLNMGQMFKNLLNNSDEKKKDSKYEDLIPTCFPCIKKKGLTLRRLKSCMPSTSKN